jgi:hypothetical protein
MHLYVRIVVDSRDYINAGGGELIGGGWGGGGEGILT